MFALKLGQCETLQSYCEMHNISDHVQCAPLCEFIVKNDTTTAQKVKFSIKDFLNKRDQIRGKRLIWSRLQKKNP